MNETMNEIEDIVEIIVAVLVFVIGFLFAIPSPIDLAVISAESFRSVMPSGTPTQMLETWILALRILGIVLILADIIALITFFRSKF
jgi:hypothetical protein